MAKIPQPTTVSLQLTRCQIAALVFAAVLVGVPCAVFGLAAFGSVLYRFGVAIGFNEAAAGIASYISCVGIVGAAIITTIYRACESKWWWE